MVYRGKPSSACERCALRRIRCDRKDGGCSQCRRAAATCIFRDKLDVMFPAHLTHTKDSMRRFGGKAIALDSRRGTERSLEHRAIPAPSNQLNQDMDEFALSYCYHNHIIHPPQSSNMKLHVLDEKLLACLKALGMASYSMIVHSSELHKLAFRQYLLALRAINTALESLKTAREDATLLALLTLTCLESISATWHHSLKGLSTHVQGMVRLIELRGPEQMKFPSGRLLFIQCMSFIVTDCHRAGLAVPDPMHSMLAEFQKAMEPFDRHAIHWETMRAFLESCALKNDVIQGRITDPRIIVEQARRLDQLFAGAYKDVPYSFEFEVTAHRGGPHSDLPAYKYTYRNTLAISSWNGTRNGRIFCNAAIINVLQRTVDSDHTYTKLKPEIDESRQIIRQMQMDILAGVPQFLGLTGADPWKELDCIAREPFIWREELASADFSVLTNYYLSPGNLPALRITRGIFLLFNLGMVGRMTDKGSELRSTVSKILRAIGMKYGLSLGFTLAAALEENRISKSILDYQRKADAWVVGERAEEPLMGKKFPDFPERT